MNSYALRHPRLDVVAIVTAQSALDAMSMLIWRDQTWGDIGLDEAVWLRSARGETPSYTLFGQEDCGNVATIKEVIKEIEHRKRDRVRGALKAFRKLLRLAATEQS